MEVWMRRRCEKYRSADRQSAVSRIGNPTGGLRHHALGMIIASAPCRRPADWQSAIQQVGNLRYIEDRIPTSEIGFKIWIVAVLRQGIVRLA